jgi:hypothetical protein
MLLVIDGCIKGDVKFSYCISPKDGAILGSGYVYLSPK